MNPLFGTGLREFLFEGITDFSIENLKQDLRNSIYIYIPEVTVVDIITNINTDYNLVELSINYILNISNTPDQVTVQFQ
jgi:phage baseplate assembly protein W